MFLNSNCNSGEVWKDACGCVWSTILVKEGRLVFAWTTGYRSRVLILWVDYITRSQQESDFISFIFMLQLWLITKIILLPLLSSMLRSCWILVSLNMFDLCSGVLPTRWHCRRKDHLFSEKGYLWHKIILIKREIWPAFMKKIISMSKESLLNKDLHKHSPFQFHTFRWNGQGDFWTLFNGDAIWWQCRENPIVNITT